MLSTINHQLINKLKKKKKKKKKKKWKDKNILYFILIKKKIK